MAVYVLLDVTRVCCKIGFSADLKSAKKRVKTLQTSSPFKLELICINEALNRQDESEIHRSIKAFETGGGREWFDYAAVEVKQAIEYIKSQKETKFPDIQTENTVDIKKTEIQHFQCRCDCDCDEGCDECEEATDWDGQCFYCIYKSCALAELWEDSVDEFRERVKRILSESDIYGDYKTARAYLRQKRKDDYFTPASEKFLANLLLERIGSTTDASKARIADLLYRLCGWYYEEEMDSEGYPTIFVGGDELLIVFYGEFQNLMDEVEQRYLDCFWDIDEFGIQLFCAVFNRAREFREVPLELAHGQLLEE